MCSFTRTAKKSCFLPKNSFTKTLNFQQHMRSIETLLNIFFMVYRLLVSSFCHFMKSFMIIFEKRWNTNDALVCDWIEIMCSVWWTWDIIQVVHSNSWRRYQRKLFNREVIVWFTHWICVAKAIYNSLTEYLRCCAQCMQRTHPFIV